MEKILDKVNCPEDLKTLDMKELNQLADELREMIIEGVSKTGGHLAPNLGTVELTVALHYFLDSPKDKIVWDVGHQCYAHKIICGRKNKFDTLRQYKGIAGFPKRCESEHDCFDTGHTSTSVAAALGMAEARDLKKENFRVFAVIGDGALSGGEAFESLNNLGYMRKNLTVILNDNKMSISPNVGGLSEHLKRLSTISFSDKPRRQIGTIFEKLGFHYFGPIDGHNIEEIINILKETDGITGPKMIHLLTVKGKGFPPAEETPEKFHGVGAFDVITGKSNGKSDGIPSYQDVFAQALIKCAEKDEKILGITAAMPSGTSLNKFGEKFPERFYDVGIAEQCAVTFCAGLASQGMKPFAAIYSTFLQRAFDQIILDVAMQKMPVKFAMDRGGLVGDDGETHHGVFDLSYLGLIPNMVLMSPKDENELQHMIKTMAEYSEGPIAVRYPRGKGTGAKMDEELKTLEIGKGEILKNGKDITIIGIGLMVQEAIKAAEELKKEGIDAEIINARFAKPLDEKLMIDSIKKTGKLITIEENAIKGGFGSRVVELLEKKNIENVCWHCLGIPDRFIEHGTQKILREECGITSECIVQKAKEMMK